MKKIKHSKFKNTGFLFELLTRQITLEILNNSPEKAKKIVSEFFGVKTELSKELRLFNLLINEKYNTESKAEKFIDAILEARTKLDEQKLIKEKYNLIKSIKENFDIDSFLASPVTNYRVLASIHKLFEAKKSDILDVKDIFDSKITIVEHISTSTPKLKQKEDRLVEDYKKQEKDLRLLTYKILVETFNKKYSNLNNSQKNLLREYINNITNTSKFGEYYNLELKNVVTELHSIYTKINDKVTKIKLKETINVLKTQKIGKKITDEQVSSLMMAFELIKEIEMLKNESLKNFIEELIDEVQKELDEANVTGNIDGYQTPFAFSGKNSKERRKKTATQLGYSIVDNDVKNIDESEFPSNKVISEGKVKRPVNRWLELKNDQTKHPHKKLAMGLKELKYQLMEVEKFFMWYNKIKNINELDSSDFWKRTNSHIYRIKERLINIAKTLQEIEK